MRLVAKHAQVGYQTPGDRPGCRNCAHFDQLQRQSVAGFAQICSKHAIEVTSGGICNSHKLQRKPGEAQLAFLARQRDLLEDRSAELEGVSLGPELAAILARQKRRPQAGERRA